MCEKQRIVGFRLLMDRPQWPDGGRRIGATTELMRALAHAIFHCCPPEWDAGAENSGMRSCAGTCSPIIALASAPLLIALVMPAHTMFVERVALTPRRGGM